MNTILWNVMQIDIKQHSITFCKIVQLSVIWHNVTWQKISYYITMHCTLYRTIYLYWPMERHPIISYHLILYYAVLHYTTLYIMNYNITTHNATTQYTLYITTQHNANLWHGSLSYQIKSNHIIHYNTMHYTVTVSQCNTLYYPTT